MFTPQEIQEQTFSKAVFGGYDMQQVDDFLEPLTEDYIMLYKENSVLKSKMKVLVEKLEEYRGQEAAMKQQMAQAQAQCDRMIAEAQSRSATIVAGAETTLRSQSDDLKKELAEEQTRLDDAKRTALNFIDVIEQDIKGHLELLEKLKSRDLTLSAPQVMPQQKVVRAKPYDWQADQPSAPVQPVVPEAPAQPIAPAVAMPSESAESIAEAISENMEKLVGADPKPETPPAPVSGSEAEHAFAAHGQRDDQVHRLTIRQELRPHERVITKIQNKKSGRHETRVCPFCKEDREESAFRSEEIQVAKKRWSIAHAEARVAPDCGLSLKLSPRIIACATAHCIAGSASEEMLAASVKPVRSLPASAVVGRRRQREREQEQHAQKSFLHGIPRFPCPPARPCRRGSCREGLQKERLLHGSAPLRSCAWHILWYVYQHHNRFPRETQVHFNG